jgi:hypothetical protein
MHFHHVVANITLLSLDSHLLVKFRMNVSSVYPSFPRSRPCALPVSAQYTGPLGESAASPHIE